MIVFMGVAGAGKSIQGKLLAEKIGGQWISIGELLRQDISGERKREMLAGKLLEDKEIIKVVEDYFANNDMDKECVLDGFPRTMTQAKWLVDSHSSGRFRLKAVIHLQASKSVVKPRLLQRGRPDDNEAAIDMRFEEYETHTLPIVDWFKSENLPMHEIDGERDVQVIHQEIIHNLSLTG